MAMPMEEQPLIVVADDDTHSARLLLRTLAEHGATRVKWHGDADRSLRLLAEAFTEDATRWPALLIVDLKTHSMATPDFITAFKSTFRGRDLLTVAIAPTLEREVREALLAAGAAAVFERHAELSAYQREAGAIIGFLERHLGRDAQTGVLAHEAAPALADSWTGVANDDGGSTEREEIDLDAEAPYGTSGHPRFNAGALSSE